MSRLTLTAVVIFSAIHVTSAQNAFFYPPPAAGTVTVSRDVPYGFSDSVKLLMDVYRPSQTSGPAPVLIFFNRAAGAQRTAFALYARWGEITGPPERSGVRTDPRAPQFSGVVQALAHTIFRFKSALVAIQSVE